MDPEIMYAEITSGDPGSIRSLATDAADRSRAVDQDARNIVDASSRPLAKWVGGQARREFELQGLKAYLNAAMASFRLYRGSEVIDTVAEEYRGAREWARDAIQYWRDRNPDPMLADIYRSRTIAELREVERAYNQALRRAVRQLDRVEVELERWAEEGAALDYINYLKNDALPGPRIPDSRINGDRDGWIQQGLAHDGDTFYVTSYQKQSGTDGAQVTLIDDKTGVPGPSVPLGAVGTNPDGSRYSDADNSDQGPNHVGGVVVQGDQVLVTSTDVNGDSFVYVYRKSDIDDYRAGEPVEALNKIPAPASSYATTGPNGELYLGNTGDSKLHQVHYDPHTGEYESVETWNTPPGSNGVAVEPEGKFTFATQAGRDQRGALVEVDSGNDGGNSESDLEDGRTLTVGNMVQNLAIVDGRIVSVAESGAGEYLGPGGDEDKRPHMWRQTHLGELVNNGDGYEVEPRSLGEAAGDLDQAERGLDAEHGKIRSLNLPASWLGEVGEAGSFASAATEFFDLTALRLKYSLDTLVVTVDGLIAARTLYEDSDRSASVDAQRILDEML